MGGGPVELSAAEFPDAQVVVINPDDVLVLAFDDDIARDEGVLEQLRDHLSALGLAERTLVCVEGVKVGVVRGGA